MHPASEVALTPTVRTVSRSSLPAFLPEVSEWMGLGGEGDCRYGGSDGRVLVGGRVRYARHHGGEHGPCHALAGAVRL